jgi:fumarate reductase flavoprotein subunit
VVLDDRSRTFNTELISVLELSNLLDVAEAILEPARTRTESRGAHQRTDFPERDDDKFLAHSMTYHTEAGTPRVEFTPVTITRWPPAERVYGR